jgi:hypothetical protein
MQLAGDISKRLGYLPIALGLAETYITNDAETMIPYALYRNTPTAFERTTGIRCFTVENGRAVGHRQGNV